MWWDVICVPGDKQLRAKALANMHMNYKDAEVTLVHDCFLRNLPWVDAETACIAILMSPWFSRGWTSLELAKPEGKVKIAFKGDGSPLIKDLDDDILAKNEFSSSTRHKLASSVIARLRNGSVKTIDDLLIRVGSRHTSWLKDVALISALLVEAEIEGMESQQEMYQAILKKIKGLRHAHLFHNLPTIHKGRSWAPVSLLDMPLSLTEDQSILSLGEHGEAQGMWKVIPLESVPEDRYIWKDIHPFIAAKLRSCLKLKSEHIFLVEPDVQDGSRALLVKRLFLDHQAVEYQFVGAMYFHPPVKVDLPVTRITLANFEATKIGPQHDHEAHEVSDGQKIDAGVKNEMIVHSTYDETQLQQIEVDYELRAINDSTISKDQSANRDDRRGSSENISPLTSSIPFLVEVNDQVSEAEEGYGGHAQQLNDDSAQISPLVSSLSSSSSPFNSSSSLPVPVPHGSLLLAAAKDGDEELVAQLVHDGADMGFQDEFGQTPTWCAAERGSIGVVKLLLEQYDLGYDCMDSTRQDQLSLSTPQRPMPTVEQTFKRFEAIYDSADDQGRTPLLIALKEDHKDISLLLLSWYEINCNVKDQDGRTPLSWAASKGYHDVVKLLLGRSIDADDKDRIDSTALSWAAQGGHEAVVRLLLESNRVKDVDSVDSSGRTPLAWAAAEGHLGVMHLLLESPKGKDVHMTDGKGRTMLSHVVEHAARGGHVEAVQLLLALAKTKITYDSGNYRTPVSQAALGGHFGVVQLLLESNKVDDLTSKMMSRALDDAVAGGNKAVVQLLLASDKIVCSGSKAEALMEEAAYLGHVEVLQLLLDSSGVRDVGFLVLEAAVSQGHKDAVQALLKPGRVRDLDDHMTMKMLRLAVYHQQEAVVRLLLESARIKDVDSILLLSTLKESLDEEQLDGCEAIIELLQDKVEEYQE